jgi:DNA polymerase elongation subunit (family B)
MLKLLCDAKDAESFKRQIPLAIGIAQQYAQDVVKDNVSPFDLVFTTTVSREISEYKVNNTVKAALLQLKDQEILVQPGRYVQYVIQQRTTPHPRDKVCLKELLSSDTLVDKEFYLRYLARCVESMLNPFGYTDEKVYPLLLKRSTR